MKIAKPIFAIACLAVWIGQGLRPMELALAAENPVRRAIKPSGFKQYFNDKYAYSVDYPSYLVPGAEPDAHDGLKFASKNNSFQMSVWGTWSNWLSGDEMTIEEQRDWTLKNLGGDEMPAPRVTYKSQGKNWFVVSGLTKDNIFYEKTIRTKDTFATVLIIYPVARKLEYASVVEHIASSLKG